MSVDKAIDKKKRRRRNQNEDDGNGEAETRSTTGKKGRSTPGRRSSKEPNVVVKSGNVITRPFTSFLGFIGSVRAEIVKVTWPTRENIQRLTLIVLAVTIASAIILGILSFIFTQLVKLGLDSPIILLSLIAGVVLVALWAFWRNRGSAPSY